MRIDGGNSLNSLVTLVGDYRVNRLTIDAGDELRLFPSSVSRQGSSLTVNSSVTNNGRLTASEFRVDTPSTLLIDGNVLLQGTGTLILRGDSQISGSVGSVLTNAQGHTILGQREGFTGDLGGNAISIVNQGLIQSSPTRYLIRAQKLSEVPSPAELPTHMAKFGFFRPH